MNQSQLLAKLWKWLKAAIPHELSHTQISAMKYAPVSLCPDDAECVVVLTSTRRADTEEPICAYIDEICERLEKACNVPMTVDVYDMRDNPMQGTSQITLKMRISQE